VLLNFSGKTSEDNRESSEERGGFSGMGTFEGLMAARAVKRSKELHWTWAKIQNCYEGEIGTTQQLSKRTNVFPSPGARIMGESTGTSGTLNCVRRTTPINGWNRGKKVRCLKLGSRSKKIQTIRNSQSGTRDCRYFGGRDKLRTKNRKRKCVGQNKASSNFTGTGALAGKLGGRRHVGGV